jgi:transcriptional regulator PpsR
MSNRSTSLVIEASNPTHALARFAKPADSLSSIDPETAAALITMSSDLTLVVDNKGIVVDVAFANAALAKETYREWIGRRWVDTVAADSRGKIEDLIRESTASEASRWRQINYPGDQGPDVPIRHSVVRYGAERRLVVVGRDLRVMAALQQRLAEAQQSMEREYARIRGAERRYRILFQLASEAVLIVDVNNQRIIEANPAAAILIAKDFKKLVGQGFADLFDAGSRQAVQSFVAALRVAPRVDNVHVQLDGAAEALLLSGSLFRQESAPLLIVMMSRLPGGEQALSTEKATLLRVFEKIPDAFVVTDPEHRILTANVAFLDLVQMTNEDQIRGQPIERWVGRPGADMDVLFANLRTYGAVRHFSTILRGEYGSVEDVELAAAAAPGGDQPCVGFAIRGAGWKAGRDKLGGRELPRTVEQFADLVGRVPLKTLVRETTDLIERLCIEAALELTRDNRASAADMLGLSRQGLYAKLRRYGLGDLDSADDAPN